VVAEATALVEGTVADSVQSGWPPPPWAWINKLAHAGWADICDLSMERHGLVRVWEGAEGLVAQCGMVVTPRTQTGIGAESQ
jgi:hypothetical protein